MTEHSHEVDHTINLWSSLQEEWNSQRNMVDHENYDGLEKLESMPSRIGQLEVKKESDVKLTVEEEKELEELRKEKEKVLKQYDEVHKKVHSIGTKPTEENIKELKALREELKALCPKLMKLIAPPCIMVGDHYHAVVDNDFTGCADLLDAHNRKVGRVTLTNGQKDGEMYYRVDRRTIIASYKEEKLDGKYWRFVNDKLVSYKEYDEGHMVMYVGFTNGQLDYVKVLNNKKLPELTGMAFFKNGMLYRFVEKKNNVCIGFECSEKWGYVVYRGGFKEGTSRRAKVEGERKYVKEALYTRCGYGQAFIDSYYFAGYWNGDKVVINGVESSCDELLNKASDGVYDPNVWTPCKVMELTEKTQESGKHKHHKHRHYDDSREKGRRLNETLKKLASIARSCYKFKSLSDKRQYCICEDVQSLCYYPFNVCYGKSKGDAEYLNTTITLIPDRFREEFFGIDLIKVERNEKKEIITLPPPIKKIVDEAEEKRSQVWKDFSNWCVCCRNQFIVVVTSPH